MSPAPPPPWEPPALLIGLWRRGKGSRACGRAGVGRRRRMARWRKGEGGESEGESVGVWEGRRGKWEGIGESGQEEGRGGRGRVFLGTSVYINSKFFLLFHVLLKVIFYSFRPFFSIFSLFSFLLSPFFPPLFPPSTSSRYSKQNKKKSISGSAGTSPSPKREKEQNFSPHFDDEEKIKIQREVWAGGLQQRLWWPPAELSLGLQFLKLSRCLALCAAFCRSRLSLAVSLSVELSIFLSTYI